MRLIASIWLVSVGVGTTTFFVLGIMIRRAMRMGSDDGSFASIGVDWQPQMNKRQRVRNSATRMAQAFQEDGLLVHNAWRATDMAMGAVTERTRKDSEYFTIEHDCGYACTAWSLVRHDLPFNIFMEPQYWDLPGVGFLADVRALKQKVVSMTPVDADTVWRDCNALQEFRALWGVRQSCTRTPDDAVCLSDRIKSDARARQGLVCAHLSSIEVLDGFSHGKWTHSGPRGQRGPLNRFCLKHCFDPNVTIPENAPPLHRDGVVQALSAYHRFAKEMNGESMAEGNQEEGEKGGEEPKSSSTANPAWATSNPTCGICTGEKPFWCDTSRFPEVHSAPDWVERFAGSGDINSNQCKFHVRDWDTFTDTIKLFRHEREQAGLPVSMSIDTLKSTKVSSWNEVNLLFDGGRGEPADEDEQLHEDSISGVYFVDFERWMDRARPEPLHLDLSKDTDGIDAKRHTNRTKAAAAEMVRAYNRRHPYKQINLFRVVSTHSDQNRWRYGSRTKLSDFLQVESEDDA